MSNISYKKFGGNIYRFRNFKVCLLICGFLCIKSFSIKEWVNIWFSLVDILVNKWDIIRFLFMLVIFMCCRFSMFGVGILV